MLPFLSRGIEYGDCYDRREPNEGTALHRASYSENEDSIRMLLKVGAEMSSIRGDGETTLPMTTRQGKDTVLQLLLDASSDVLAQHAPYQNSTQYNAASCG